MQATDFDVAIVGGGFAGTIVASQLLRRAKAPLRLAVIERESALGRGVAYGTPVESHLLNLPAGEMSAFPDEPDHFVEWLQAQGRAATPRDFIPRPLYAAYLADVLAQAAAAAPAAKLTVLQGEAIGLLPASGAFRLRLRSGDVLTARQVVLAIGQFAPAPLRVASGVAAEDWYVEDPWTPRAIAPLPDGEALLIGTGLTAVDVALALLDQGHARRVHMISRRAQLPSPQREGPLHAGWFEPHEAPLRISQLMRLIREEIERAAALGLDWRAVVDGFKPHVSSIWQRLPLVERRRFLRHARSYWEAHRNRLPPPTARRLEALREAGRVCVYAGRLSALAASPQGGGEATIVTREGTQVLHVGRVVNSTGPDTMFKRNSHPLVQDVIGTGLGRLDRMYLGFDVAPDGRLIDEDGVPTPGLYTLGWPRQGQLWEATTVPSLGVQARDVATRLLGE